jgi:hypothetical protein
MIKFFSRIKKIEHVRKLKRAWKEGTEIKTEYDDMGWYVLMEGSWEALYVGNEEPPELKEGDEVEVIIQRKS